MLIGNYNSGEHEENDDAPICRTTPTLNVINAVTENTVNFLSTSNTEHTLSLQISECLKCIVCDKKVPEGQIIELIKHIRNTHGKDSAIKFRIQESKYLPLKCGECEYCFTTQEIFDKHINEPHGESKKYTKCEWYAKTVYKMRKRERKLRKNNSKKRRLKMFEDIAKSTFRCPLSGCDAIVHQVTEIVSHVEQRHSPKEFIVFMTSDDFFDFLGQRCKTCNFLYQRTEVHSSVICRKYQDLSNLHPMSSVEVHRLLNHMVDNHIIGDISSSNSSNGGSKRRKRRKRPVDGSKTSPDSNGNDESDDGDVDMLPVIKGSPVSTPLYHRCPVLECTHRSLRSDNPVDFSNIKLHMRLHHNSCHNLFCQTKFSSSEIRCRQCNFWFSNQCEFDDHKPDGCFSFFPLERLDEVFDMMTMRDDYKYDYFGAQWMNDCKMLNNSLNNQNLTSWLDCPIEKCSKLDEQDLTGEYGMKIVENHISLEHEDAMCKIRTSLYKNITPPIRCAKCNWFCFTENEMQKHGSNKPCNSIVKTVEKMKLDGTWDLIKFKKQFALKKRQDIDDIIQLKKNCIPLTNSLKCIGCGSIFGNSKVLEQHLQKDHNKRIWVTQMRMISEKKRIVCTKCTFAFDNVSYHNHIHSRHCSFNERMVQNVENLCKNYVQALPIKIYSVGPRIHQLTKEQFASAANSVEVMSDAVKDEKYLFPFPKPEKHLYIRNQLLSEENLKQENIEIGALWPCPQCNQKFPFSKDELYQHIYDSHGVTAWVQFRLQFIDDMQEEVCGDCGFFFRKMYPHDCNEYRQHLSNYENNSDAQLHPCPECGEMYTFLSGKIYSHLWFKHGLMPWLRFRSQRIPLFQEHHCPKCKTWGRKDMKYKHNHNNCDHMKSLLQKHGPEILKTNKKREHEKDNEDTPYDSTNFPCPYCAKQLNTLNNDLDDHILTKHGRKEWTLFRTRQIKDIQEKNCKHCKFYFSVDVYFHDCEYQQKSYRRYIDNIINSDDLSSNENSFNEEICIIDERVSLNSSVNVPIGSSNTPATCPECYLKFSLKALYSHIKSNHGVSVWLEFRRNIIPGLQENKCEKCKFVFCSERILKNHKCHVYREFLHIKLSHLDTEPKALRKHVVNDAEYTAEDEIDAAEFTEEDEVDAAEYSEEDAIDDLEDSVDNGGETDTSISKSSLIGNCPYCDVSITLIGLYVHIQKRHGRVKYLEYRRKVIPGLKEHKCNKCGFVFHKAKHPHQCHVFRSYPETDDPRPTECFDANTKKIRCEFCDFVTVERPIFYYHLRKVHSNQVWLEFRKRIIPGFQDIRCSKCNFCYLYLKGHHCNTNIKDIAEIEYLENRKIDNGPEHISGVTDGTTLLESLTNPQFACPGCGDDQLNCAALYAHVLRCLSPSEWLNFRTTCQPTIHEHKCQNLCGFYLPNPEEDHDCKTLADTAAEIRNPRTRQSSDRVIEQPATNNDTSAVRFTCPICDCFLHDRTHFLSHIFGKHSEYEQLKARSTFIPGMQESRCTKCLLYFLDARRSHKCDFYIRKLPLYPDLAQLHKPVNNVTTNDMNKISCPLCPKQFKTIKMLYAHLGNAQQHTKREMLQARTNPLPGVEQCLCTHCGFYFDEPGHKCGYYQNLSRTIRESISSDIVPSQQHDQKITPPSSDDIENFTCPICTKITRREKTLSHLQNHSREGWLNFRKSKNHGHDHRCNQCLFLFSKPNAEHDCGLYSLISKALKPSAPIGSIKCPKCPLLCRDKHSFYCHIGNKHPQSEWLEIRTNPIPGFAECLCPRCGFYITGLFSKHRCSFVLAKAKEINLNYPYGDSSNTEEPSQPAVYMCPHCGKKDALVALEKHIKSSHGEESLANFKEREITNLKIHQCKICKLILQAENETHDCKLSIDNSAPLVRKRTQTLRYSVESALYKCPECNSQRSSNKDLITHLAEKHTKHAWVKYQTAIIVGVQEYPCLKCKFVFSTPDEKHPCEEYSRHTVNGPNDTEYTPMDDSGEVADLTRSPYHEIIHTCPVCDKKDTAKAFFPHLRYHSRDVWLKYRTTIIPGVQEDRCNKCKMVYGKMHKFHRCSLNQVLTKDIVVPGIPDTDIQNEQTENNCSMLEIQESPTSTIEGTQCTENLKPNNRRKLSPARLPEAVHTCPECKKKLPSTPFFQHLRHGHSWDVWYKYRTSVVPGIQEYRCKKCNFVLKDHTTSHACSIYSKKYKGQIPGTPKKPPVIPDAPKNPPAIPDVKGVACEICGKRKPATRLNKHILRTHGFDKWYLARTRSRPGSFEYKCQNCTFYFEDQTKAQSHNHECQLFCNKTELMAIVQKEQMTFDSDLPALIGNSGNSNDIDQLIGIESVKDVYNQSLPYITGCISEVKRHRCPDCDIYLDKPSDNHNCRYYNQVQTELPVPDPTTALVPTNSVAIYKGSRIPSRTRGVSGFAAEHTSCPVCHVLFDSFIQMDDHFRNQHDLSEYVLFRRQGNQDFKQSCIKCDFKFPTMKAYFHHFSFCQQFELEKKEYHPRQSRSVRNAERVRKRRLSSGPSGSLMENQSKKQCGINDVFERDREFSRGTPISSDYGRIYQTAKTYDSGVLDHIESPLSSPRVLDGNEESDGEHMPGNNSDNSMSVFNADSKVLSLENRHAKGNSSETDSKDAFFDVGNERNTQLERLFNSEVQSDYSEQSGDVPENLLCDELDDYVVVDEYQDNNDDSELKQSDETNDKSIHGFNSNLHKLAAGNGRFQCLMKNCTFVDTFKRMNYHLRLEHPGAYQMYRYCMLSIYGIMEKQCEECNYQFVTQCSYEHHKNGNRCSTYKESKLPPAVRQIEIINSMKTHLVNMD